jgi:hypothetical protein
VQNSWPAMPAVDAPEPSDGSLHRGLGVGGVGDVELDGQQVVVLAQGLCDSAGVTGGGDDGLAGLQCGPGDLGTHAAAGAGDEPHLLLSHATALPSG